MTGADRLLELLRGAVAAARAAGASDAEASFEGGLLGMTRFANSYFTQNGVVCEAKCRVRVALGERVGAAATSALEPAGLADAAALAVELARHQPASRSFHGFARPDPARRPLATGGFDAATAELGPGDRADALARVFERASREKLTCAGTFVTGPREVAVATASGVAVYHRYTEAALDVIARDEGDASGYATHYGPAASGLSADALADEAVERAARSRDATDVEPGAMDVVLMPPAVAEAMEWMAMTSFSGKALLDGTSLLDGRQGERLCSDAITIFDDAGYPHPQAIPLPFDAEGVTKERVVFVDRGVGGRVATDLTFAARLEDGRGSTGHALPVGEDLTEGPTPTNLVVAPGDASVDELVGRVERGLFVTRFHYVNGFLDTRRAAMTGMTRDGTFLIENGRLGRAVHNLRWTESFLEAFSRVGGVGRELRATAATWTSLGTLLCPALLLRGFKFTGRSR